MPRPLYRLVAGWEELIKEREVVIKRIKKQANLMTLFVIGLTLGFIGHVVGHASHIILFLHFMILIFFIHEWVYLLLCIKDAKETNKRDSFILSKLTSLLKKTNKTNRQYNKTLYIIPTMHSEPESTGSRKATKATQNDPFVKKFHSVYNTFWNEVDKWIEKIIVNTDLGNKIKIYQEGIPSTDTIKQLRKLCDELYLSKYHRNIRAVRRLMLAGAEIVPLENPIALELASNAYSRYYRLGGAGRYYYIMNILTSLRDRAIAQRINTTLGTGEIGILFIGAAHDVARYLQNDIAVVYV